MTSIRTRAANYGERADITARTMLITVFGDSIAPSGGAIWIGDLINLMKPFSFSDRLVRTSLFRLGEDGLFDTERIGRRSRYSLSRTAQEEFAAADARIYYQPAVDWDNEWTIVFANDHRLDDTTKAALARALRWQGFGRLAAGVFASPTAARSTVAVAASRVGIDIALPTARARFSDLDALVQRDTFDADFGVDESAAAYNNFIADWRWFKGLGEEDGHAAFLVRSMMVHDFRRARLADPELPAPLLPPRWPGQRAYERAAQIFHTVDAAASAYLGETWGLKAPALHRFPTGPHAD
ncbi:MAG: PaaX family transcriptional regulator C-terminal domain-containing protein [Acidimicrobiales bacterium]